MTGKDDWRITDQEEYMMDKPLFFLEFVPFSAEWDHEHCEFCWATFSLHESDEHEGYCTSPDNGRGARWICKQCFRDFKDRFRWKIQVDRTMAHE